MGLATADPPIVLYAASSLCADPRYPALDGGLLIACDKRRLPTVRLHPETLDKSETETPHSWPSHPILLPHPRPLSPVAQLQAGVAWVANGKADDADLWWLGSDAGAPVILDGGPGDQHHPIASGDWLAWVSAGEIAIWNTATGEKRRIPTNTGFNAAPTIDGELLCWEVRTQDDIDIHCNDKFIIARPGHQTHPIRVGERLFFRENDRLMSARKKGSP